MLLVKILAGIHKIYFSQISLSNKVSRIKYLGNRICKQKHIHVGDQKRNCSNEINEQQLIMEAIDDTLLTPQEKILKILKSMR